MNRDTHFDLLVLDYGGVYSFEYNVESFNTIMQNTFGRAPDAKERKDIEPYSHRLAAGKISSQQYVRAVARILNVREASREIFEDSTIGVTHDPSPEMIDLVEEAKKAGVFVALLSNMFLFEVIKTQPWGRYRQFDYAAFSANSRLTKSDPDFFLRPINHFGASPARTLYVDDIAEYVHTAERLGISAILADKSKFANAEDLSNSIRETLHL